MWYVPLFRAGTREDWTRLPGEKRKVHLGANMATTMARIVSPRFMEPWFGESQDAFCATHAPVRRGKVRHVGVNKMIAIDPGAGGGMAWVEPDGTVHAVKMPDGMTSICDLLLELRGQLSYQLGVPAPAVMELVHAMPGDGRASVGSFLRHCGWLDAALYLAGYSVTSVTPAKWQSGIGVPRGETLPRDMDPAAKRAELARRKGERKAWIKEQMQRRYPLLRVTLHTADALGMLTYSLSQHHVTDNMPPLPM